MRIATIGWGSLIWEPEGKEPPETELQISLPWSTDGPLLPVEFARQSMDKRLTLVIRENQPSQPTLWAKSHYSDIAGALDNLMKRERMRRADYIHYVIEDGASRPKEGIAVDIVREWLAGKHDLDAAIWTGLPPRFNGQERVPSLDEAVGYLRSLTGEPLDLAREYIQRTPHQIRTAIRVRVEAELGWDPILPVRGIIEE